MRLFLRHATAAIATATVEVEGDDALFGVSDFAGTVDRSAGRIRLTRAISDISDFDTAAPGTRIRFAATLLAPGQVILRFAYTGLIIRDDVYNDIGSVYVGGTLHGDFACPVAWAGPGNAHPVSSAIYAMSLIAGTHQIEAVLPYSASVDFEGVTIPETASLAAPVARVTKKGVIFGDSIVQGFFATKIRASWPFLLAGTEAAQLLDLGFGGRETTASDGTAAGATGADFGLSLTGVNDAIAGTSVATIEANHAALQDNFRTANPTAPLYVLTPTWASSGAIITPIEDVRQAIRDAVAGRADANTFLIEGATGSMPTGAGNFPDGIHPNDAGSVTIAAVLAAAIT